MWATHCCRTEDTVHTALGRHAVDAAAAAAALAWDTATVLEACKARRTALQQRQAIRDCAAPKELQVSLLPTSSTLGDVYVWLLWVM